MMRALELERALATVCAAGPVEVRENGRWLAGLEGLQYEVRNNGETVLLHLWSPQQSLVRRVVEVREQAGAAVVLHVAGPGHARPGKLEILAASQYRQPGRVAREQFRERMRQFLANRFPDETPGPLTTTAALRHSLSGSYTRGMMHRGSDAYAVMGAAPEESAATIDAILTFGLIWLEHSRGRQGRRRIGSLRLFVPTGTGAVLSHRIGALARTHGIELYEYDPASWRVRRVAISDAGNLATWIVPRREVDAALAAAAPSIEPIRRLDPDAIEVAVPAQTQDVSLRFRGLEFARWRMGEIWFGLDDRQKPLTPARWPQLEALVRELQNRRSPLASETKHRLFRAYPERWLETLVAADPSRVDPRLDPRFLYAQVPALSGAARGIIDLLGVTRDGRLAVIELKASEDIHVIAQAIDYWLRVRWHQEQDDFHRYGYFPDVVLQPLPPLLFLVAPGFQFHPTGDVLLGYLTPEIEIVRVGLAENWRRGLRVIFRK